ncbi:MAG: hypothetical protein KVP17_005161 [Porospora cf. gigantea B]|uniref:uncharacterized protein n=1 Tax=Porospora cf. gigantea B TaxID=2853592 RepID=UPI003571C254|nr:MAG: hypothetical protein KVP17_005161 [Porospora cf. gigantea B]
MWTQKPDLAAEVMPHKGFNQVRVCLAYFEKVEDWPDLSAGLSSLVKAFQRVEQPFEALTVPHQAVVLKRLAQCLNPRLPAGIHVLALAAYDHILKLIGSDGLVLDLAGVLLGLLPVPAFATTQVRTQFLAIIRLHFVALGPRLSACMPGLVCSLLSGVNSSKRQDDECVHMLDELKHMMAMDCFMHCLWEAVLRDKAVRKAAMSELLDQMPLWDQTRRLASPECECRVCGPRSRPDCCGGAVHRTGRL